MKFENLKTDPKFNGLMTYDQLKESLGVNVISWNYQQKGDGEVSEHYSSAFDSEARARLTIHQDLAKKLKETPGLEISYKCIEKITQQNEGVNPENVGKPYKVYSLFTPNGQNIADTF